MEFTNEEVVERLQREIKTLEWKVVYEINDELFCELAKKLKEKKEELDLYLGKE